MKSLVTEWRTGTNRPDVSEEVMNSVDRELEEDGYEVIDVQENDLKSINSRIR